MDKIVEVENQLRNLSVIPPNALEKDTSYKALMNFMKYRDMVIEKRTKKSSDGIRSSRSKKRI